MIILFSILIFLAGYLINIFFITVVYHRGLTHRAIILNPILVNLAQYAGVWITGIDSKAWVCMHRLHHMHSDTKRDPHSPAILGVTGVLMGQLKSYERVLNKLIAGDRFYNGIVADIPFPVSAIYRKRLWLLPYFLHLAIAAVFLVFSGSFIMASAYFFGIMSHPVQGWMVNALAHSYGYRNFSIQDRSKNNAFVSLLVFGEGYQNNHHARPKRANFAIARHEVDAGYFLCVIAEKLRFIRFPKSMLTDS